MGWASVRTFNPSSNYVASLFGAVPYAKIVMAGISRSTNHCQEEPPLAESHDTSYGVSVFSRSCRCHSLLALARCPPLSYLWLAHSSGLREQTQLCRLIISSPTLQLYFGAGPHHTSRCLSNQHFSFRFRPIFSLPRQLSFPFASSPFRPLPHGLSPSSPHIPGFLHNTAPSPVVLLVFFLSFYIIVCQAFTSIDTHC